MTTDVPVTVFTGYLGSGKTTLILSLLKQLPSTYRVVLLKNEYGDVEVDSKLVSSSVAGVQEMLNGCLCCVLVGRMSEALNELKTKYSPDRIIVETSGTAFPAPISLEIRRSPGFSLDGIITVIDCENFRGYEDVSYAAKLSAQYSDLIVMNKCELVDTRGYDDALDGVLALNEDTPIVKAVDGAVDSSYIFGIDSKLAFGPEPTAGHHAKEIEVVNITGGQVTRPELETVLEALPKSVFYRVKGWVLFDDGPCILNFAFGRWTLTFFTESRHTHLTVMMAPYESEWQRKLAEMLPGSLSVSPKAAH